jgi:signal transduction histidine kinase
LVIVSVLLTKTIRSTTFKLALASIAIFGTIVVAFLIYVYSSTLTHVQSEFDRSIIVERHLLEKSFQRGGRAGLAAEIQRRLSDSALADRIYLLADASFDVLAGNLKSWPTEFRAPPAKSPKLEEWSDGENRRRVRVSVSALPNGDRLLLGRRLDIIDAFHADIRNALIATLIFIFLLTAGASIAVTRRTIGRIESINATSRAIMESDLKKRIPLRGTDDEWDQVAGNLNSMLDRIERLMGELRQATDNVAHDLRTPLTRIRGRLERAYYQLREDDCHHRLIGDTIADLDVVLRVFASLTRISQIETNIQRSAFRTVNLFEVAERAAELYEAGAEERCMRLRLIGDRALSVMGDPDLLFDAISNLLDNAIKHGRGDGEVTIETVHMNGRHVICVADNGPGIPASEYPDVLKRFYRLERSRQTPGNGLGLSLVAAVANIHGAKIEMSDNSPGLRVQLSFPVSAYALFDASRQVSMG